MQQLELGYISTTAETTQNTAGIIFITKPHLVFKKFWFITKHFSTNYVSLMWNVKVSLMQPHIWQIS